MKERKKERKKRRVGKREERKNTNKYSNKDMYNGTIHNDNTYNLSPLLVVRIIHE